MKWKQFFVPVENLSVKELERFMSEHEEGSYTLLDVRQPKEYEQSRIPGGKLIPLSSLTERLSELDKEKPIVVY